MKKIILTGLVLGFIVSCGNDNSVSNTNEVIDKVEIPFTKEGELEFINENGEPFKKINIEIAETINERARGLMDRSEMADDNGMIFIFGDDEVRPHTKKKKQDYILIFFCYLFICC